MTLILGDCTHQLKGLDSNSVDLIYLDPPFFTQKTHTLKTRDDLKSYSFDDTWSSIDEYVHFIKISLIECKRVLKETGSIFLHCDKYASHHLRILLDNVFGVTRFQSEIIWSYKRWSNSKKGLLNSHQNIYFYSKSENFKFNTLYTEYSETTNLDQILQERKRNNHGKSAYKKDDSGNIIWGKEKKGVPLSDVWEIPFLNPKANERVGYPTQKPVLLLQQIIKIASDEGDTILDPFCGSGTTLVASKLLNRKFIGIDISAEAINLSSKRLDELVITESKLLKKGRESYQSKSKKELAILNSIDALPVYRNAGIDGFLKTHYNSKPVPIKIQKDDETLHQAKNKLISACKNKKYEVMIVIKTHHFEESFIFETPYPFKEILVLDAYDLTIKNKLTENRVVNFCS
jgi:site-specific DNA-methyltransferase (adenine-specific)